ncbi:unnamed protein product [Pseudo-nitzschia multistriata]|uniref:Major facilitator superfamily (MFS) profile domain-containing protein n=1 Tax=Pseudo-nitzschia multistriata TaxID=183589 RepID=A0A448ZAQ7_9STRA|nr:unnamed protein product [Pseudo-nitzschia multistriata]
MDRTTALLAAARFTSAIARLCLGPLLPMLSLSLGFSEDSKPILLSAYSSGYLLTQIGGGYLADRHGYAKIVSVTVGLSSLILFYVSSFATTSLAWIRAFFCLGLVAGPLFPAGSAAISANVQADRRAASFAIIDASASAGTTVASLAPIVADYMGWRFIYRLTGICLLLVALGVISSVGSNNAPKKMASLPSSSALLSQTSHHFKDDKNSSKSRMMLMINSVLLPVAVCAYLCHCCDNFTKYSINSWAATMLVNRHKASPAVVSSILAGQEAVGVASKLLIGTMVSFQSNTMTSSSLFVKRGTISAFGFVLQGIALWYAFQAANPYQAGFFFIVSSIAAGTHSVGFRPVYLEASPPHAGSISGFGNSIASCASVLGPMVIGSSVYQTIDVKQINPFRRGLGFLHPRKESLTIRTEDWSKVAFYMICTNVLGAMAALVIGYSSMRRRQEKQRKEYTI